MKKFLICLFLALVCVTAQAETIAVFKINLAATITGGGTIEKRKYGGWVFVGETNIFILRTEPLRKRFTLEQPDINYLWTTGAKAKTYESLFVEEGEFRSMYLKGADVPNPLYATTWKTIPRLYTVTGTDQEDTGTGDFFIWEYKGGASFDKARSNDVMSQNLTLTQAITRAENTLIATGYSEEVLAADKK